jgi:hypothetical protein
MIIETKYNIGDEVWFMDENRPIKGIVSKLDIDVSSKGDWYIEHYKVKAAGYLHFEVGQSLFPTKEELLNSL